MEEIWKDIPGYESLYKVSNLGNVLSLNYARRGFAKQLTPKCNSAGRLWVELAKDGKRKPMLIHRLVGMAFIPNPNNYPQINHKDENPKNNHADNLEWCTQEYNIRYFYDRRTQEWFMNRSETPRYRKRITMAVDQFTKDGVFIRRWNNSRQVMTELGLSDWSISECCRGNRKSAYGYVWRYASISQ